MKNKFWLLVVIGLFMTACAMPETKIQSADSRPKLMIQGAPLSSILYLDGLKVGPAHDYNGKPGILIIEPGTHEVTFKSTDGQTLHHQRFFVESEIKTIILPGLNH